MESDIRTDRLKHCVIQLVSSRRRFRNALEASTTVTTYPSAIWHAKALFMIYASDSVICMLTSAYAVYSVLIPPRT
jgi:hypothetical protein